MVKILTGVVVSKKMEKTVVIEIERKQQHPRYKKIITRHKRLQAHNENNDVKLGDVVDVQETKPISKHKSFIVISKAKSK